MRCCGGRTPGECGTRRDRHYNANGREDEDPITDRAGRGAGFVAAAGIVLLARGHFTSTHADIFASAKWGSTSQITRYLPG